MFNFNECVHSPPVTCDAFHSGLRVCRVRQSRIDHRFLELNAVPPALDEVPRREGRWGGEGALRDLIAPV